MSKINHSPNPIFGNPDRQTLDQYHDVLMRAERGALMADAHLGYLMPIGGVMAYRNKVSPVGVGFDIGCGNMAVKLNRTTEEFDVSAALDIIQQRIDFGIGGQNPDGPQEHELFEAPEWGAMPNKRGVTSKTKRAAS
ncbi:MAG: RtcB family protein [Fodinibius sp.]|nr:RtcB family protein [Fodinibius sp.]